MPTMRAALLDRYGPPEVLYEGRVPVPVPAPGEVLVKVHATSVNGGELAGRAGRVRLVTGGRFPQRTGIDFTGEVAEVTPGVRGPAVGDRVWGVLGRTLGSAAEYLAVRPGRIARAPRTVSLTEAASLPAGGTTGLTALRAHAGPRPGERLLVRGAAGGVGSVAVQLGKALGARVTALAGPGRLDFVRELGADEAYSYTECGPADLGPFDVIMDTAGTEHRAWRRRLAPGGRMVAISFDLDRKAASLGHLLASTVHGRARVRFFSGDPRHCLLTELAGLVDGGALRPVVDSVRPLAEIAAAHRALEAGGVRGKHVIRVAADETA
ncbi:MULTISPECIES: NAD(P)-dependent alcohol dehydrogenase [Streptomyces]|uniref:Dehydrogenase n=1 Tax=Streptomyces griseus TaxID=1911 RepID=A0A380PBW1_STRGR|nr:MULTISPECIES: NAD(P)-dependent alcohol dehydrogenase [Streptomyces]MDQ0295662.1 NADPH:quinone reductase-like Zn-dependent oxidoreductase [Streptomyces sp. DSM 41037]WSU37954.1 NAD(P)-dependent alcohol dehydrogenase [Streptomyces gougerotii]SUP62683.1 Dehydrogenase [Streptomyces griseus]